MTCKDEETDSSTPMKHAKDSMATVKISRAASLTALLLLWEATLPLQFSWSEAPQCPPAPEGENSLVLGVTPPSHHHPHLRPQRLPEAFLVNLGQKVINQPCIPTPSTELSLMRRAANESGPDSSYFKQLLPQ